MRRALVVSPALSAWLNVCASPAKLATGPSIALASELVFPSASGAFSEFSSAKAWLLSSADAAAASPAKAHAAGAIAHSAASSSTAPSAASHSCGRRAGRASGAGEIMREVMGEVTLGISRLPGQYTKSPMMIELQLFGPI